jgi:hypothetical protein
MAPVYEEDVPGIEVVEDGEIDILEWLPQNAITKVIDFRPRGRIEGRDV